MVGEFDNPKIRGIIPRSLDYIFKKINKLQNEEPNSKYNINISLIQIYLEMIQDLFEPNNQVKIREDPDKGVFLENCLWINIKNSEEFKELKVSSLLYPEGDIVTIKLVLAFPPKESCNILVNFESL